ncbi:hypothetical protein GDO81_007273 [Engystomops pustulosus]|uniref:Secreted protein n=1 Tax=Engystomops pustulosus TaxID=76066 RepID=A0AAV7C670_ENGPU|nr:hypothetical protein GDO81_007273 [Engystomops pustulosus]
MYNGAALLLFRSLFIGPHYLCSPVVAVVVFDLHVMWGPGASIDCRAPSALLSPYTYITLAVGVMQHIPLQGEVVSVTPGTIRMYCCI